MAEHADAAGEPRDHSAEQALESIEDGLPAGFGRNAVSNTAVVVVSAISGLLLTPYLLSSLGRTEFGIWALVIDINLYLTLANVGLSGATLKLTAEDAHRRPERFTRTVNTSFFVLCALGLVAFVVAIPVSFVMPDLLGVSQAEVGATTACFMIYALSTGFTIPFDSLSSAIRGYQRFDLYTIDNFLFISLLGGGSAIILVLGGGIVALSILMLALTLAVFPLRFWFLKRIQPSFRIGWRYFDRSRAKAIAAMSGWFMTGSIASTVSYRTDLIVAGIMFGPEDVAVYAVAAKLAQLAWKPFEAVGRQFMPAAASHMAADDIPALQALLVDGTRAVLLLGGPLSVIIGFLAHDAIAAWVGPGYGDAASVLMVLGAFTFVRAATDPLELVLTGSGGVKLWARIASVEAVVNLALSLVLGQLIGLAGIALGTMLGVVLVLAPGLIVGATRVAQLPIPSFFRRVIVPHLLPTAACAGVLVLFRTIVRSAMDAPTHSLDVAHLLVVSALGLIGLATYWAVYMIFSATKAERHRFGSMVRLATRIRRDVDVNLEGESTGTLG